MNLQGGYRLQQRCSNVTDQRGRRNCRHPTEAGFVGATRVKVVKMLSTLIELQRLKRLERTGWTLARSAQRH